jgi:hypothetical protein
MTHAALEIATKVAVAVFLFVAGRAYPWIGSWVRYWRAKRFWRPIVSSRPTVVIGKHETAWEPSALVGLGDAKALDELRMHFRTLHLPSDFPARFVDEVSSGATPDGNYLCIGGPDTSPDGDGLIADLWRRSRTSYAWARSAEGIPGIYDGRSGERFEAQELGGYLTEDYALIVRMRNPYCQPGAKRWVLLFAGCSGFGTWGALRFSTTSEFLEDHLVASDGDFECLVSVEVANRAPGKVSLLDARALEQQPERSAQVAMRR